MRFPIKCSFPELCQGNRAAWAAACCCQVLWCRCSLGFGSADQLTRNGTSWHIWHWLISATPTTCEQVPFVIDWLMTRSLSHNLVMWSQSKRRCVACFWNIWTMAHLGHLPKGNEFAAATQNAKFQTQAKLNAARRKVSGEVFLDPRYLFSTSSIWTFSMQIFPSFSFGHPDTLISRSMPVSFVLNCGACFFSCFIQFFVSRQVDSQCWYARERCSHLLYMSYLSSQLASRSLPSMRQFLLLMVRLHQHWFSALKPLCHARLNSFDTIRLCPNSLVSSQWKLFQFHCGRVADLERGQCLKPWWTIWGCGLKRRELTSYQTGQTFETFFVESGFGCAISLNYFECGDAGSTPEVQHQLQPWPHNKWVKAAAQVSLWIKAVPENAFSGVECQGVEAKMWVMHSHATKLSWHVYKETLWILLVHVMLIYDDLWWFMLMYVNFVGWFVAGFAANFVAHVRQCRSQTLTTKSCRRLSRPQGTSMMTSDQWISYCTRCTG